MNYDSYRTTLKSMCLLADVSRQHVSPSSGRGLGCCWQCPAAHCTPAPHTTSAGGSQARSEQQAWKLGPSLYLEIKYVLC